MSLSATRVDSTDGLAPSAARSPSVNSTYFLAQAEAFFAEQLELPDAEPIPLGGSAGPGKLPRIELVKTRDLCEDIVAFATEDDTRGSERPTVLAWLFALYERVMSSPLWPPTAWTLMPPRPLPGRVSLYHSLRVESETVSRCTAQHLLFDGLSRVYGGRFRGSVVVNCLLGVTATTAVLYSLVHHARGEAGIPIATAIEFVCLFLIGYIYVRGSTPDLDEEGKAVRLPTMKLHFTAQRWHQRWLEYRILAERFRYVDMLLPLGKQIVLGQAVAPKHRAGLMWHQRYFEWCVGSLQQPEPSPRRIRDCALSEIAAQIDYHERNHQRRGTIAHRLHLLGKVGFVGALVACVVEILFSEYALKLIGRLDGGATMAFVTGWLESAASRLPNVSAWLSSLPSWVPFLSAWLPVTAAAAYAIMTHAEYAKAVDASSETHAYIQQLHKRLVAMPNADKYSPEMFAELSYIVTEFAATAIAEATGWRAMLRDKNVPLV